MNVLRKNGLKKIDGFVHRFRAIRAVGGGMWENRETSPGCGHLHRRQIEMG